MKKRILSILLTICMLFCLTPISVFAEEVGAWGSAAIQLGTDALNKTVNTEIAPTVYFGQNHENNPAAWRVIGYDGSGVTSSKGDITLLAAGAMGVIPFVDTILNNEYAPSNLKTAIDALAEKLTTEENAAVKKRTLTSGSYDGENTDCVAGGQVDNAVFWPLSAKEAIAVNNDLRALNPAHPNWVDSGWWLRSPGSDKYRLAVVRSEGSVQYSGFSVLIFNNHRTVRPAFNLNLNSVLFASAAVGGKPDGGLAEVSKYSGNEWKLTLLDSRRNFAVTETTASGDPGDTLTLHYNEATTGINEYISVILADNSGAQYYGRVAQPTAESGTVEIKIPSDIAPGDYTLKMFSEQCNGDHKTDYAGALREVKLTDEIDEQFTLTPGGRYYFDLSAMNIPGTVNSKLPDSTLHYVPFTYVGTVNAYKLTSETATTEEYAQREKYPHSLFVADFAVTNDVSWDALNAANLIFGKDFAAGGVGYTLRAPSVGSARTGSSEPYRGTPQSNEWDRILDKNDEYIKNRFEMYSWGQDTIEHGTELYRAGRGFYPARQWDCFFDIEERPFRGFRPVLEILNPGTLGSGGLKVVTLELGGGKLGGSSDAIQIIVKTGSEFTAPASGGLTRPDGNTGSYFMWLGSNGKLYAPGDNVPADVTALTVQWTAPTYTVTLHANGGSVSPASMTTGADGKLASLPTPTRSSYSFNGWYTEKNGGTKVTTDTVFSANTTVYAHWTYTGGGGGGYNPPVTYYTLRFETGGGSDIPSVQGTYNTYIDLSQYVPTWRGHTFIGWYSERSLMNKVSGVYLTKDMTVYAGWRVDENPNTGANPFTDVSEKDWFYGDVMFVYENGLMLGTSKTLFSPHGTATRGMMATILWRMEGSPAPKGKNSFTDVEAGKWYADAITWTAENSIFAGYGKDKFGPDDPITREQLAAIFYRYADYKGYDLTVKGNLDKFKDADKITDYAKTAMQWAVGSGLVKGKSGNLLDPQGTATRAEIAAMLHRFIEKYELVQGKAPGGLMGWIDPKRLQIPKTGDSSVLGLWGFSLCTSLAGCLALTTWQIRRRREEQSLQSIEK